MIGAVIGEDDAMAVQLLERLLTATGKVDVIGTASDGIECLQTVEECGPDVVFLDIEMPRLDGIDVAQALLSSDDAPLIVFITGHDEYAVKAFELAAVDYVVKTADMDAFAERVEQAVERLVSKLADQAGSIEQLRESLAGMAQSPLRAVTSRLPVKDYTEGTVRLLDPKTVMCVQRSGRRVILQTTEKSFPTYLSIDQLERRLRSEGFVRANRGALLNLSYVDHLIPNGDGSYDALVRDGSGEMVATITVSRGQAQALLKSLGL